MPIGISKLNTISAVISAGGGSDAPVIPTGLIFTRYDQPSIGYNPSVYPAPKGIAYVGVNNGYAHWATSASSSTSQYQQAHICNFTTSPGISYSAAATITAGTYTFAVSSPGLNGTSGGQYMSIMATSTAVRTRSGVMNNWSTGTSTGTTTGGTIGTSQARTSSYTTPTVTSSHSPYTVTPSTHRFLMAYHTVVSTTNYIAIASGTQTTGSNTPTFDITLVSSTQIASSATANFGNWIDSCGFTTASSTETHYAVGYTGSATSYIVSATKILSNTPYSTAVTPYSGSTVLTACVDTLWDDYSNNKSVAVSCVTISGNTYLRSIRITNWNNGSVTVPAVSLGTQVAIGSQLSNAKISKISGSGLGLLTYLNSTGNRYLARFISVDSANGNITVGNQFDIDGVNRTVAPTGFSASCSLDASNKLQLGMYGYNAGSWVYSWYRSTNPI